MEESLSKESEPIDIDSAKLDAIIQLRTWQKKMHTLVDRTYKSRLHQIESLAHELQSKDPNEELEATIHVHEAIPENFDKRIERTVRISRDELDQDTELIDAEEDDEDAPVIVDLNEDERRGGDRVVFLVAANNEKSKESTEGTVSRVFHSQPVQSALASTLARTLTQIGVITATSTTTAAATTMAKTAIIATACGVGTVAYGVGRVAYGTTRKLWSYMASSDD